MDRFIQMRADDADHGIILAGQIRRFAPVKDLCPMAQPLKPAGKPLRELLVAPALGVGAAGVEADMKRQFHGYTLARNTARRFARPIIVTMLSRAAPVPEATVAEHTSAMTRGDAP